MAADLGGTAPFVFQFGLHDVSDAGANAVSYSTQQANTPFKSNTEAAAFHIGGAAFGGSSAFGGQAASSGTSPVLGGSTLSAQAASEFRSTLFGKDSVTSKTKKQRSRVAKPGVCTDENISASRDAASSHAQSYFESTPSASASDMFGSNPMRHGPTNTNPFFCFGSASATGGDAFPATSAEPNVRVPASASSNGNGIGMTPREGRVESSPQAPGDGSDGKNPLFVFGSASSSHSCKASGDGIPAEGIFGSRNMYIFSGQGNDVEFDTEPTVAPNTEGDFVREDVFGFSGSGPAFTSHTEGESANMFVFSGPSNQPGLSPEPAMASKALRSRARRQLGTRHKRSNHLLGRTHCDFSSLGTDGVNFDNVGGISSTQSFTGVDPSGQCNVQEPPPWYTEAQSLMGLGRFAEAARFLIGRIPHEGCDGNINGEEFDLATTARLLTQAISSWEHAEAAQQRSHDSERRALTAKLQSFKDHTLRLKEMVVEKAALQAEVSRHTRLQKDAEDNATQLRHRLWEQNQEVLQLRERLKKAERAAKSAGGPAVVKQDQVVQRLAQLECEPLRQCNGDSRAALKKKILLKWHPDKQPSREHAAFATQVMQELQNRPEWA